MSDKTRLTCIILTILCIIAVLVGQCRADDFSDMPEWQQIMLRSITPVQPRDYGSSYIGSSYSETSSNVIINQNINRNNVTVIVETPEPYYYYTPAYDYQHYRQHFDAVNRSTRR